jgi:CHRD domain-containing protein
VGRKGKSGPVLVPLCVKKCENPSGGTMTPTPVQAVAFRRRPLYVNIHTALNPAGEIRGNLRREPEAKIQVHGCQPC